MTDFLTQKYVQVEINMKRKFKSLKSCNISIYIKPIVAVFRGTWIFFKHTTKATFNGFN